MNILDNDYIIKFDCKWLNEHHLNYHVDIENKLIRLKHILNIDVNVLGGEQRRIKAQIHRFMEYKRKAITEAYIHELCVTYDEDFDVPPLLLNSATYTIQKLFPEDSSHLIQELEELFIKEHCHYTDELNSNL